MKSKAFLRYYLITALALLGTAAIPFWHFARMVHYYCFQKEYFSRFANYREVLAFTAVTAAILLLFLLVPLFGNMSLRKKHIFVSVIASFVFCVAEVVVEIIAVRLYAIESMLTSGAPFYISGQFVANQLIERNILPLTVRLHYYVLLHITWGSVLNVAVCFTLAAVAVGLFRVSFFRFAGRMKVIQSFLAVLTVLALYAVEFAMLKGKFYSYAGNSVVNLLLHALIIITPALIVQILLRFIYNKQDEFAGGNYQGIKTMHMADFLLSAEY
jgi:hypothetical protein